MEYVVDRVETTSVAFMGLTMGCARCHDHKYDPIKQKEFYQFFAFFNNVEEKGLDGRKGNADPLMRLDTPEQETKLADLDAAVKAFDKQLAPEAIAPAQTAWEKTRLATLSLAPRDGLVAHYEFDNNLSDSSGAYQTGRVSAGDVGYVEGPVGRAVSFNGEAGLQLAAAVPDPKATVFRGGVDSLYQRGRNAHRAARRFRVALRAILAAALFAPRRVCRCSSERKTMADAPAAIDGRTGRRFTVASLRGFERRRECKPFR